MTNESELLARCRDGDVEAFERLIAGYEKKVFGIAYRMLGNYDDASEITQEVFIKLYKSIGHFKGDSAFATWLYRICTNTCLDQLRKRKNSVVMVSMDEEIHTDESELRRQIPDDAPGPDAHMERNELRQLLNDAMAQLSEEHRSVVILRDIQCLSYEEIGEILKLPPGTVKSRINRARATLKSIIAVNREQSFRFYV